MLRHSACIKRLVALTLTSVTLFTGSAFGQSPATRPDGRRKEVAATQEPRLTNPEAPASEPKSGRPEEKVAAEEPRPKDLENEVETLKADNTAVREQLRRMEEQQKALLELVDRMQRRLDGTAAADAPVPVANTANVPGDSANAANAPVPLTNAGDASAPPASAGKQEKEDRYQDGMVIWKTPDDANVPFLLRFNINTQLRYLNSLNSDATFTDHLGVVREVSRRNDITVNRTMAAFTGYVFDKRLQYQFFSWTSAGAASIILAGSIGWRFNKHLTLTGGYTGVPGTRSMVNTFPFFAASDRTMADNFFRPGFTQGIWANGEVAKGLYYMAFLGNGLNTLNVSANKIDRDLLTSGSVWWEPLGAYGEPGKARNMYDDYFAQKKVRIRIGTAFTRSREDRFSNLDVSNPENTALYNSDGVLTFSTGAFAPGVTLQKALYKMWAVDWGLKYNGLAINGQYYARWLSDFEADGPLPLSSTFDHGFELSVGKFVIPKKLEVYGRGSMVFGQFNNPYEYAGGVKWHFLPTERLWLQAEVMRVNHSPYTGAFTPYNAGINGWVPMIQTYLAF